MRLLRKLAYPALGLIVAFGVHTAIDAPSASAQCRYYYGTTNPDCYDEEFDTSPCIYYYGTQEGCRTRWNTTVDESLETNPTGIRQVAPYGYPYGPGNYGSDPSTYGSSSQTQSSSTPYYGPGGPTWGPQYPGGYYGAPGYGYPPAPYYGR